MVRASHRNRRSGVNPGGSEVNGFPEKVRLATDGLEHAALADRAAVFREEGRCEEEYQRKEKS
jgi:hypothetical protein